MESGLHRLFRPPATSANRYGGVKCEASTLHPNSETPRAASHLNFVIPSEAEGPAVPPRPQPLSELSVPMTNAKVRQPFNLCHPEGSRGTCSSPSAATPVGPLHPNTQRQGPPTI